MTRIFKIIGVVARNRLDSFLDPERLPFSLRVIIRLLVGCFAVAPNRAPRSVRLRIAIESLGPIFIKFGQMLSTRRDLLPDDVSEELANLQDNVSPFPPDQAIEIIESSLGNKIDVLFDRFDREPLASASVAQVHSARLHCGDNVVIKVIRPGIEKVIRKDIRLMYFFARLLMRVSKDARRLRPLEVVADYERTILDELDLLRESANASQLRRNFLVSHLLFIPQIYWDYCRPKVMVMERIHGVPVSDIQTLKACGTDMKKLAERGVELFFTQVFRDRFFHADMHPGNIFVDVDNPAEPRYIGIDCGIVGTLETEDQRYLACNLLAFFRRDYRKVAQLHIDSGWVPSDTKVGQLESAIRTVCEPIFEKPLKDISFGQLLVRLFQTARRFNMEIQPQLVLLEKTLLNVEGLGRELYPELNLWNTAQPFLEGWMKEQVSPSNVARSFKETSSEWLFNAPVLAHQIVSGLRLLTEQQSQLVKEQKNIHKKSIRTRITGIVIVTLAVASFIFPGFLNHIPEAGVLLAGLGAWMLAH
ncbi:MAG: ubiquinone biosynthesis regulatory protein kinase UbiB [Endozoicomonas sp. (ex Botrylloides leachii)]|nr:ubiquinone biosynthesis regulatory protein kinase UbiB [Endozoicomonas sp. (ex Botrylloides leachii)]